MTRSFARTATIGAAAAALVAATAVGTHVSASAAGPQLYQRLLNGATIVLGSQSQPTTVLTTGVLPIGQYHVETVVGAVIGQAVNVVCGLGSTGSNDTTIGNFGVAGNGSSTSGTGPNGIYGSAVMNHTVKINQSGDRLVVVCNAGAAGTGTYVSGVSLTAQPLGSVIQF